jgi:hypothetical protein
MWVGELLHALLLGFHRYIRNKWRSWEIGLRILLFDTFINDLFLYDGWVDTILFYIMVIEDIYIRFVRLFIAESC